MRRIVYREIASCIQARLNCIDSKNAEWIDKHAERAKELVSRFLPSGSGIDNGSSIYINDSTGDKLVFACSYHHMNAGGFYDGWTDHTITVRPSLVHGIALKIGGRNRNDIKEYLNETFRMALTAEFDE